MCYNRLIGQSRIRCAPAPSQSNLSAYNSVIAITDATTQPSKQQSSASSRSLPSFRDSATTFSRRRAFLLCETRRFRVAPRDPCSIGIRPRPTEAAVCHFGGLNAQAPTRHLQPRPSASAHLARSQRNASQLSLMLRRYRARPRLDTSSSALACHTALRELRAHRAIHRRRRLSFVGTTLTTGPIHEVFGLCRRGIPKSDV